MQLLHDRQQHTLRSIQCDVTGLYLINCSLHVASMMEGQWACIIADATYLEHGSAESPCLGIFQHEKQWMFALSQPPLQIIPARVIRQSPGALWIAC